MECQLICTFLGLILCCFIVTEKLLSLAVGNFADGPAQGETFLEIRGFVKAGSYYYRAITDDIPTEITLIPTDGDVDLYISSSPAPTFDLNNHNISAYSCGKEEVTIDKEYPRPYYIGIYCSSNFNRNCTFHLSLAVQLTKEQHFDLSNRKRFKSTFGTFIRIVLSELMRIF